MNGDQYTLGQIPGQDTGPRRFALPSQLQAPAAMPPQPGLTGPGQATGEQIQALDAAANEALRQRQLQAAAYLARVQGGQSAALAGQQLGAGGLQQQQMAAGVRGPLMQRAAMYGQARAADQMLAQAAQRRAQEELAAQAMLQQSYGAEAAERMRQAQLQLQSYGMAKELQAQQQKEAQEAAAAEEQMIQQVIGASIGSAAGGMAYSDHRLKRDVQRPRSAYEQELYEALRGGV